LLPLDGRDLLLYGEPLVGESGFDFIRNLDLQVVGTLYQERRQELIRQLELEGEPLRTRLQYVVVAQQILDVIGK